MKNIFLINIISISLFINSCNRSDSQFLNNVIGYFDIKDSSIAIAYYKNNIGSIYYGSGHKDDSSYDRITFPKEGWDNSPRFSSDGKKIVYLRYPKANFDICKLCLIDIKTKKVDTLITNEPLILEACFSNDDSCIYYISAGVFKNYSPIASKSPHEMYLFEFNLNSRTKRQITYMKEYSMQGLVNTYSDNKLFISIFNPDSMSLGVVSVYNGKFTRFSFSNDPRYKVHSSYRPIALKKDSVLYEAPYEIYKYDFLKNESIFLLRSPDGYNFDEIKVDNDWKNMVFKTSNGIFKYNLSSKQLTKIDIIIN
jgi:hypothetical protein